jgi:hypothetical protein
VTVRNNIVRNSAHGVSMDAKPESNPAVPAARLAFSNNVFEKIGDGDYPGGRLWQISGIQGLTIQHNTGFTTAFNGLILYGSPASHVRIVANLFGSGTNWVASADGKGIGTEALNAHAGADWVFRSNVVVGARSAAYPPNNFYPTNVSEVGLVDPARGDLRLLPQSRFHGAGPDGTDIGADFRMIERLTAGVVQGPKRD